MARRWYALAIATIAATQASSAQGATMVWALRGSVPDSIAPLAQGMLSDIDLKFTVATDGTRHAIQLEFGQNMTAAVVAADLSSARAIAVFPGTNDSVHVGIVLPPELSGQLGGSIGFRIDTELPDQFSKPAGYDSLVAENAEAEQSWTNSGRTATIAGLTCEEWVGRFTTTDSAGVKHSQDVEMCFTAVPAPVRGISKFLTDRYARNDEVEEKLKEWRDKYFGGRELMPIRVVIRPESANDSPLVFELVQYVDRAPDPSFFDLPADLEPFPIEMIRGMMPQQQGS